MKKLLYNNLSLRVGFEVVESSCCLISYPIAITGATGSSLGSQSKVESIEILALPSFYLFTSSSV
jgi:hypothetical protein